MGLRGKATGRDVEERGRGPQAGSISKRIRQSRSGIDHTLSSPSSSTGSKIASLALEGGVGGLGGPCWLWIRVLAFRRQDPAVDHAGSGHQQRIDTEVEVEEQPHPEHIQEPQTPVDSPDPPSRIATVLDCGIGKLPEVEGRANLTR
jgi:hypothetical protein